MKNNSSSGSISSSEQSGRTVSPTNSMPNVGEGEGAGLQVGGEGTESNSDPNPNRSSGSGHDPIGPAAAVVSIVISQPAEEKGAVSESDAAAKKGFLPRDDSYREQCRVCQQQAEEPLIDLGCRCRGELAKAHRTCIKLWFQTRGSNKCEICQQVAANVSSPDAQPSTNYCVWSVDSAYGGTNIGRGGRARGCFSPLWIAFAILIGGLLLDVLISVSLGVSALPVNIIIGVLIVLGLGTAFRLALECCQEWGTRRYAQNADLPINPGYHPAV